MPLRETLTGRQALTKKKSAPLKTGLSRIWLFLALIVLLAGSAALFVLYGHSYVRIYLHDIFVTYDGIHRLAAGQVPHLDFSTPLGALAYYIPYAGYLWTGSYAGAVAFGSLLLAMLALPLVAWMLSRRVSTLTGVVALAALAAMLVLPVSLGQDGNDVSVAMYYNRWSWAALVALSLAMIPPFQERRLGALTLGVYGALFAALLFLVKISFFLVGVGVFALMLLQGGQRRYAALIALVLLAGSGSAVYTLLPGFLEAYQADIRMAYEASGFGGQFWHTLVVDNIRGLVMIFAAFALAASVAQLGWRNWLILPYLVAACVVVQMQNFQAIGLMLVLTAFLAADRWSAEYADASDAARVGLLGLILVFLAPFFVDWVKVTLRYTAAPQSSEVVPLDLPQMGGVFIFRNDTTALAEAAATAVPNIADLAQNPDLVDAPGGLNDPSSYALSLADGLALLQANGVADQTVLALDFSNPFALLLDLPRRSGGYNVMHPGRLMSKGNALADAELFSGVDFVMEPSFSTYQGGLQLLKSQYGPGLLARYEVMDRSDFWTLYRATTPE